jgi:hypothetical protein
MSWNWPPLAAEPAAPAQRATATADSTGARSPVNRIDQHRSGLAGLSVNNLLRESIGRHEIQTLRIPLLHAQIHAVIDASAFKGSVVL